MDPFRRDHDITPDHITTDFVASLVATEFPEWASLVIVPVEHQGWDNRTFRLGPTMSVRLPSAKWYVAQVEKEQHWLPVLAPQLPVSIPSPIAMAKPSDQFPWPWSVYGWLDGELATHTSVTDDIAFARDLADFLVALYAIDPTGGPKAGVHNFWRGGSIATYDDQTRATIAALGDAVDANATLATWDAACASEWSRPPVWVHGDIAPSNLLVSDGRLAAVLDFGCSAIGDPACDLVMAWTWFAGDATDEFRARRGHGDRRDSRRPRATDLKVTNLSSRGTCVHRRSKSRWHRDIRVREGGFRRARSRYGGVPRPWGPKTPAANRRGGTTPPGRAEVAPPPAR